MQNGNERKTIKDSFIQIYRLFNMMHTPYTYNIRLGKKKSIIFTQTSKLYLRWFGSSDLSQTCIVQFYNSLPY